MQKLVSNVRNRRREAAAYLIALALCLWILEMLLKLKHCDLSVPFIYDGGDATFYSMVIKTIITKGWHLTNDSLGVPRGMEMYDFPMSDTFHFLLIKFLGLFTSDFARIQNIFYLLTFPLTTICSFYVLRRFRISYAPAILASLLYTFTFYHFSRSQHHLMYSAYYNVPLMVLVILWVCSGELSLTKTEKKYTRWSLWNPKLICSLLICLLTASTGGAYYFFFASILLLSAGLFITIRNKSLRSLLLPSILITVMFGTFLINISPNLIYFYKNGKSTAAARGPGEAEIYGLKIALLLMPTNQHRLKSLAKIKDSYNTTPLVNENVDSSLGFIGGIGFLTLIAWLLYRRPFQLREDTNQTSELLDHLSLLNITAVLVATIGGFGSIFNQFVSPQIRGYNRISVFIAFFSLFTAALLLDLIYRKYIRTRSRKVIFYVSIVLLILLGVLDQTIKRMLPDFKMVKAEYQSDRDFIGRIESAMPPKAMIFQLPVCSFPEGESYDHFKGYLHSNSLRWSFGAMRDRPGDLWQKAVAPNPTKEMLETLAIAGFKGIYINRRLYNDGGAKMESELSAILTMQPLVSNNKQLSFFNLVEYQTKLEEYLSNNWAARSEQILNPLLLSWHMDCSGLEGTPQNNWRWCGNTAEIRIENGMSQPREVTMEMSLFVPNEGNFKIESGILNENLRVTGKSSVIPITKKFSIPPGKHSIKFTCDAPKGYAPGDPRTLVFRIDNFKLTDTLARIYNLKQSVE